MEMLKEETKLAEMAAAKDKEIREHDEKIEEKVNAKDSEKRAFNWKLAGGASLALLLQLVLQRVFWAEILTSNCLQKRSDRRSKL